ncbi:hypothetical protein [Undibacterium squillarum]|uniref:hypothetical protein n=1 Tax=Undibacterium squillarum TaxID=1131567 RepID=UPI00167B4502|nr:hypothetical protein [Undibacterium squillarum]
MQIPIKAVTRSLPDLLLELCVALEKTCCACQVEEIPLFLRIKSDIQRGMKCASDHGVRIAIRKIDISIFILYFSKTGCRGRLFLQQISKEVGKVLQR